MDRSPWGFMVKSPWIAVEVLGQFDQGKYENCSPAILGSNFRVPGSKILCVFTHCNMLLRVKIKIITRLNTSA